MTVEADSGDPVVVAALTRCGATVGRLVDGVGDATDLDTALADLFGLPDDLRPSPLAGALVVVLLRLGPYAEPRHVQHVDALLGIADRDPPPWPEWADIRMLARALAPMGRIAALATGDSPQPADLRALLTELGELEALLPARASEAVGHHLQLVHTMATSVHDAMHDDEAALRRIGPDLERLRARIDDPEVSAELTPMIEVMSRWPDLLLAERRSDLPVAEVVEVLQAAVDAVPPHRRGENFPEFAAAAGATTARLRALEGLTGQGSGSAPTDQQIAALLARAEHPDAGPARRATSYRDLGVAVARRGSRDRDPSRIDEAVGYQRQALAAATAAAPISTAVSWSGRPDYLLSLLALAETLALQWTVAGRHDSLVEAEQLLVEARELAVGPENMLWAQINERLSSARALLGAHSGAHQAGLDGLRRHAWKVLLQSDPAAATAAARGATSDATRVARRLLAAGRPAEAIQALDAGRALVLFAATELHDVPTRLDARGRADLAERWLLATASGEPEAVPVELRREALAALSTPADPEAVGAAGPLDPPTLPEIRAALAALDADALVYLVPATSRDTGYAVIAPAQGPPASMELPGLTLDDRSDLDSYLYALSNRDAARFPVGPLPAESAEARGVSDPAGEGLPREVELQQVESRFADTLDTLCGWAWQAAIGPLLEQYFAHRPAAGSGRPPRVVLVPMGSLARVPWQAARRPDGTYAVQLAEFSQAASARFLCASAVRTRVPLAPVGLVVGDPDTGRVGAELTAARVEAYAVHQAFYRGGRYLGRRPDGQPSRSGAGTAAQIRDWLTSTRPGAGAMLHLACHGVVQVAGDETSSYLLLAGRERLTTEELIAVLAEVPQRVLGLVVLAACRTGVSSRGYDEAYSLGTAFLAGGARSVLSTQWSIPDQATSVLMFMFHHFLATGRRPARDALRRAQLWMLDPQRQPPEGMPPQLRRHLAQTDPAEIVAWAGFVHWGQ
ncbi:CHAT domain-containing protein [Micromonospora sp. WMMD714]|uniref:CHAT domain-containing protein n=1 Tax=Micromonospora sp. WMMD714 TaxID=3016097 RepID=UPI00249AB87C|nr:CHAT domain-containing protein [Micromonospora sp. WMMD714]WFE62972.1 CHAT domain-containing protein [Micromonospora sp. WMMD714]